MYLPDKEIERVAVGMIAEFGKNAEKEVSAYIRSAEVRGTGTTIEIWERVARRIVELNGGDNAEVREAA
jgi:hypothetical protein